MMVNAGIKSDITTFNAISSRTRKLIQARRHSEGSSLRTVVSSPTLPLRGIGLTENKRKNSDVALQSSTVSDTRVDSNKQEEEFSQSGKSSHTSLTSLTDSVESPLNSSQDIVVQEPKDKRYLNGLKAKSTNSSPRKKSVSTDLKNARNRSSSLVILPPAPKRSSAAQQMAKEQPKADVEETDKPMQQGEDRPAPERPSHVPVLTGSDSLTSSNEVCYPLCVYVCVCACVCSW